MSEARERKIERETRRNSNKGPRGHAMSTIKRGAACIGAANMM